MRAAIKLSILSLALLTACTAAPTLDAADAQVETASFLEAVVADPAAAYASTSFRFQSSMSVEDFEALVESSRLASYQSFALTGISYQQGVGVNAAKVDGNVVYSDLSTQSTSFIWSYDSTEQDWDLDAFRFNASTPTPGN